MHLFLVHAAIDFRDRLSPTLAACYRSRSFWPLGDLIEEVTPHVVAAAGRDRLTQDEMPFFLGVAHLRFSTKLWRHVAGELLLYTARETPAFQRAPETLGRFMDGNLVHRLHKGSRDAAFDGVLYRPGSAGLHDLDDVAELTAALKYIEPSAWSADALQDLPTDEGADELEFARQRFSDLRAMFESANAKSQVIVCEEL